MRKYCLVLLLFYLVIEGCAQSSEGQLAGAFNLNFDNTKVPRGMVFIPGGSNVIGQSDEDITGAHSGAPKMKSFKAYYMDQTEISNAQYRQFVNWVRDSVAITSLGPAIAGRFYKPVKSIKEDLTGHINIDWVKVGNGSLLWSHNKGGYGDRLTDMYYSADDALPGRREIDTRKLKYAYSTINIQRAADYKNDPSKKRRDFMDIYTDEPNPEKENEYPSVAIYPDTMVWKLDYSYSQNDPMVRGYFNHPSYDDYPVVGVSWEQATAFTIWRSQLYGKVIAAKKLPNSAVPDYRLPTEAEFEYAARGGKAKTKYPWGGPYIRNTKGKMQANFKVGRGNYVDDHGLYTVNVKSYFPNDYGLYNMAGNVAEWTSTAYNESADPLLLDLNPDYAYTAKKGDSKYKKRKVVRGGSWKDIAFFLQNAVATYEYQDQSRSYIGFRCVSSYPGADIALKK